MIVVKIELWSARTGETSEIGRMYIANDGTSHSLKRGNYDAKVCRRGDTGVGRSFHDLKATRAGRVEDFPRKSYNVWRLVTRALKACFPEEG